MRLLLGPETNSRSLLPEQHKPPPSAPDSAEEMRCKKKKTHTTHTHTEWQMYKDWTAAATSRGLLVLMMQEQKHPCISHLSAEKLRLLSIVAEPRSTARRHPHLVLHLLQFDLQDPLHCDLPFLHELPGGREKFRVFCHKKMSDCF